MPLQTWSVRNRPHGVTFCTLTVAMLPVLAAYASGIPGFSVADAVLAVCCAVAVLGGYRQNINEFTVKPVLICIALYLMVLFDLLTAFLQPEPQYYNMTIRLIRYGFYLATAALCGRKMLDLELCKRIVKCVAVAATVYILLQYTLYALSGVILKGYVPFLKLYVDYGSTDYETLYQTMYRPTSFFLEPAHYARYALWGTVLYLFDGRRLSAGQLLCALFLSAGVLLSTSAQGYALLAVVWLCCFILRGRDVSSRGLRAVFRLWPVVLPLAVLAAIQLPFVREAVQRALNIDFSDLTDKNTALGARVGGFSAYLALPAVYKLIGMGFGVVPEKLWLSAAAYWLYGSGCIVFALYLLYGLNVIAKSRGSARIIAVLFWLLWFTDDSFYSCLCVLFICLGCLQPAQIIVEDGGL